MLTDGKHGTADPGRLPGESERRWLDLATIDRSVLDLRPDYTAVLIVADGLRPGRSDRAADALLRAAEDFAATALAGRPPEEIGQIAAWRDAYRSFGAKPQRTRPSVEALLRRASSGLPRIDRITDVYNAVSVRHLLPVGGEDLAAYRGPARLARADGSEPFDTTSDGREVTEHPEPGEVIWRDDAGVTCRRWNWRQCARTRITGSTVSALFILDGLGALGQDALMAAADDLAGQLAALHPGARTQRRQLGPR